jgi:hypothetical protein
MDKKYKEWIAAYLAREKYAVLGKCRPAVEEMVKVFPELKIVKGHVDVPLWPKDSRRGHWWLETEAGTIVDPTESQFLSIGRYIPWVPGEKVRVGRCMYCGDQIWAAMMSLDTAPPHQSFCDNNGKCFKAFAEDMGESVTE